MNKQNNQGRPNNFWKSFFSGALGSVITLVLVGVLGFSFMSQTSVAQSQEEESAAEESVQTDEATSQQVLTDFETAIIDAVNQTNSAVVSVSNYQYFNSPETVFSYYAGIELEDPEETLTLAGQGSGVVYKIDGDTAYIVTNNHVIEGAAELSVIMNSGEVAQAELIGSDTLSDLAVLTIDAEYATDIIEFANSDEIQVGSLAIAIGSPLGSEFASSVTQGIVSGLERIVPVDADGDGQADYDMNLLQTDAAINPGNSGGALVNTNGQLIGINSSKLSSTQIEGMGFAIPSNDVAAIIEQLETNGEVIRPVLGVTTFNLSEIALRSRVEILNLPEDMVDGVVVNSIVPGSSADAAGIERYDVITALNGEPVTNLSDLRKELYKYAVGDTVTIEVYREGEPMELEVTLEATTQAPGMQN